MDNVQAFPLAMGMYFQQGMTLRDYFAAQAMNSLIINGKVNGTDLIAIRAYEQADAMMEARK